jgi:hypothetical protein
MCSTSHLLKGQGSSSTCKRRATKSILVEILRGRRQGAQGMVDVCDVCAKKLVRHPLIHVIAEATVHEDHKHADFTVRRSDLC